MITPAGGGTGNGSVFLSDWGGGFGYDPNLIVPNAVTSQFAFPSGMVLLAGAQPRFNLISTSTVYVYGYLTAN